ncbi:MAG: UTP--glucose-1-phosphate uridylyltransferase [Spirochaetales bacterium]|nr:UTP--glucose-1-phosphate uridylyltransferase [Spirochaetales bacterium]
MKGVIVAAGYGTRFFPATKTIPKEMFPVIDKPAIDFVIDEFIAAGIKEILLITSRRKKSLEDYLDREIELESVLSKEEKFDKIRIITPPDANFYFVRQQKMMGTGQAILLSKAFVGDDIFIVAYPDDIFFSTRPVPLQLFDQYEKTGCSVLATAYNPPDLNRYGIITMASDAVHVADIVEKPPPGTEASKEASIGRFLFTPEIFKKLEDGLALHKNGEFYHTVGLKALAEEGRLAFKRIDANRLDIGEPRGYLQAILFYAQMRPEYETIVNQFLRSNSTDT